MTQRLANRNAVVTGAGRVAPPLMLSLSKQPSPSLRASFHLPPFLGSSHPCPSVSSVANQSSAFIRAPSAPICVQSRPDNGNVISLGAFKEHVKINFFKGASLAGPKGLFNAGLDAKATRSIDLRESDSIDEQALQALIRAAVTANSKR